MSEFLLSVKNYYAVKSDFVKYIDHIAAVFIINISSFFLGIEIPVALLYAPILISAHFELCKSGYGNKISFFWYLPFFVMMSIFLLTLFKLNSGFFIIKYYRQIYYSLLAISLFISSIYILTNSKKWNLHLNDIKTINFTIVLIVNIIIGVLVLIYVENSIVKIKFYERILYFIIPFVVINSFLILNVLVNNMKSVKYDKADGSYQKAFKAKTTENYFSESEVEFITAKLNSAMEEDKVFLQYNLSLEKLANHIGITRSHLSLFLNNIIRMSFYSFIAEYRISYAMNFLSDQIEDITSEKLTYQSGYNSVSTFNKHFKNITGLSVNEYKKNILKA